MGSWAHFLASYPLHPWSNIHCKPPLFFFPMDSLFGVSHRVCRGWRDTALSSGLSCLSFLEIYLSCQDVHSRLPRGFMKSALQGTAAFAQGRMIVCHTPTTNRKCLQHPEVGLVATAMSDIIQIKVKGLDYLNEGTDFSHVTSNVFSELKISLVRYI